jgi:hypothetical protein
MKYLFATMLALSLLTGCDFLKNNRDKNTASRMLNEFKTIGIQHISNVSTVSKYYEDEFTELEKKELELFLQHILPNMTLSYEKKHHYTASGGIEVKLKDNRVYHIRLGEDRWVFCKIATPTNPSYTSCWFVSASTPEYKKTVRRLYLVGLYVLPGCSNPPMIPDFVGSSKPLFQKYFEDLTEKSSLNKRRLAAIFHLAEKHGYLYKDWVARRDDEYFGRLSDFLILKGDNLTYDDLLRILIPELKTDSEAPVPSEDRKSQ